MHINGYFYAPPAQRTQATEEYYFARKLQEIKQMESEGHDIINLGIGNPDLPPAKEVTDALHIAAQTPGNHGYQPYRGIPRFRSAIAGWYERYFGYWPDPDSEVLPLMGSKEGIALISLAFLNEGDEVLLPDPGYPAYASACRLAGARPVAYNLCPENRWLPDLVELQEKLSARTRMMWINYPHMPTGAVADRATLSALVQFAARHNLILCHDNPYALIQNPHPLSILSFSGNYPNVLEISSLSKTYNMAGWRLGMLCGNARLVDQVAKVKSNMDSGMFRPLQEAAVVALGLGEQWIEQLNAVYAQRSIIGGEILQRLGCQTSPDQAGMFLWASVPDHYPDAETLSEQLLHQARVFITPGHIFGRSGLRYLRLSLCSTVDKLEEALERIKTVNIDNQAKTNSISL
ncbi:MAG: aminotransferase class I/II-fold pyridoxal phosphate-dependent enzyme [Bacteroidetes bacterium]|nr:aminotransferase class I/II-fold pyridoxal phosphate-dependent enzyme [Bacteroidota bacterium]